MPKLAKTSPKKIKIAEDTARALDLKRAGLYIRQIAVAIGRSQGWVHGAIVKYCNEHPAPNLQALRAEVMERQSAIIAAHWMTRANAKSAKVIQDSDKILMAVTGLEANQKLDVAASVVVTDSAHEQLISSLASLSSKLRKGEGDPPTGTE
jgi:hypothetical protein